MSIATELTLLANSKHAIKNSINAKGGSITDSTPFADYSTAIDNLPSGGDDSTLIDLIERDNITSITIPSGTTHIGGNAFRSCSNLTSVTIPSSVTYILTSAFFDCTGLVSITIPNSVYYMQDNVFFGCTSLTSVVLPSGITSLSQGLLQNCTSLTSVTIPSSVTSIGESVFRGCSNLTSISIPSSVTSIATRVFNSCTSLTSVTVNATTPPTLGFSVFDNTNDCPIYVPSESVAAYKAATNWSTYESRIYPIQQVATVDNTPVYNYDLGMTSTTMITSTNMQKMPTGTSLELAEGIVDAGGSFGNYTSITLPSTFSSFDDQGMIGNTTTTLTCLATTPPTAERNDIGGANLTAIYVPAANVADYQANATWSSFSSIIQAISA